MEIGGQATQGDHLMRRKARKQTNAAAMMEGQSPPPQSPPPSPPEGATEDGRGYQPLQEEEEDVAVALVASGEMEMAAGGAGEASGEEVERAAGALATADEADEFEEDDDDDEVGYEELREEIEDEDDTPAELVYRADATAGVVTAAGSSPSLWQQYDDYSLFLLGPMHPLRRAAHCLVAFRVPGVPSLSFDNLIIAFIIASSIAMAFDSCEVEDNSPLALQLQQIDQAAMVVFIAELLAKVIAYGLLFTPNAYLKDGWNRLDAFIVTASIVSMLGNSSPAFRVLRVLRVLRGRRRGCDVARCVTYVRQGKVR